LAALTLEEVGLRLGFKSKRHKPRRKLSLSEARKATKRYTKLTKDKKYMKVKIYKPTKSAMQSGKNNTKKWLMIHLEENNAKQLNPLMGWTSSSNTETQLKLFFPSKETAIEYAKSEGFEYEVEEPALPSIKQKTYAENFTN
jgi:hypothetical protein